MQISQQTVSSLCLVAVSVAAGSFFVLSGGCAATADVAAISQRVGTLEVAAIAVGDRDAVGGNKVTNDRVVAWIQAATLPLMPVCFVVHHFAKRFRFYKRLGGQPD